jgi:hypothetical protein
MRKVIEPESMQPMSPKKKTPDLSFQAVVGTGLMTKPRSLAQRLRAATLR